MTLWTEGPYSTLEECAVRAGEIYREHPAAKVYVTEQRYFAYWTTIGFAHSMLPTELLRTEYNLRVLPDGEGE